MLIKMDPPMVDELMQREGKLSALFLAFVERELKSTLRCHRDE
jgi:hypothetical protein